MEATRGRPSSPVGSWDAAERLAEEIAAGERLPELASPAGLEVGEVLHATGDADAWRFQGLDVPYVQRRGFAIGGLITFGVTAAATAAANRRARVEAEQLAAPQWRPLGRVPVLATSHRLLVLHQGSWASVWYESIRQMRPGLAEGRLELFFDDDPPYLLQGPSVPYLAVVLATALAVQVGTDAVASTLLTA
jgi:hypothetical protein